MRTFFYCLFITTLHILVWEFNCVVNMGRQKRDIPKGRFRVRIDKSDKLDKLYPIYIEYNYNGKACRKATGIQCKKSDWNSSGNAGRGELRPSFDIEYKRVNNALNRCIDTLDADLLQ